MKKALSVIFTLVALLAFGFGAAACSDAAVNSLQSDLGVTIEGGGFKAGSVLSASAVDVESAEGEAALKKLRNVGLTVGDESKAYVCDISVISDGKEVQPNGTVKVTVKIPGDFTETEFSVYHVDGEGEVSFVSSTVADGKITFETDGFSTYVFLPATAAATFADYSDETNVKIVGRYFNPNEGNDLGAQIMIYEYDGSAFVEDGYFEDFEESKNYLGKRAYYVKSGDEYFYVSYYARPEPGEWVKVSASKESYDWCVDQTYNKLDGYEFSDFTYDSATNSYENADKNVKITFTTSGGKLTKIVIAEVRDVDGMLITHTITFGDAIVDVPEARLG